MSTDRLPVVFVHGLWLHADSWGPWVELFREAGYEPQAPGWPGDSPSVEENRQHPAKLNFGDCFAYALAKDSDEPLLFIGQDFIHTGVRRVLD